MSKETRIHVKLNIDHEPLEELAQQLDKVLETGKSSEEEISNPLKNISETGGESSNTRRWNKSNLHTS